ncbi:MAG: hypothetical protein V2B18_00450 [Pseudomonadota bacterium]
MSGPKKHCEFLDSTGDTRTKRDTTVGVIRTVSQDGPSLGGVRDCPAGREAGFDSVRYHPDRRDDDMIPGDLFFDPDVFNNASYPGSSDSGSRSAECPSERPEPSRCDPLTRFMSRFSRSRRLPASGPEESKGPDSRPEDTLESIDQSPFRRIEAPSIGHSEPQGRRKRRFLSVRSAVLAALFLCSCGAWLYFYHIDGYRVESSLLFLCSDDESPQSRHWSLDKEFGLLKNPRLFHFTAQELCPLPGNRAAKVQGCIRPATADDSPEQPARCSIDGGKTDRVEFAGWLADNMTVASHGNTGMAVISITGKDPEFLKTVLASYINHYRDFRDELIHKESALRGVKRSKPDPGQSPEACTDVSEQIEKLEGQLSAGRLAVEFMKSGTDRFSGFVPEEAAAGIPGLGNLQSKLVDLEMQKKALEIRFSSQSREVRTVGEQITAVKNMIRDQLRHRSAYLEKRLRDLEARRAPLTKKQRPVAGAGVSEPGCSRSEGSTESDPDGGNCLQVLHEPYVAKKPLIVTSGRYARDLVSSIREGLDCVMQDLRVRLSTFPFTCGVNRPPTIRKAHKTPEKGLRAGSSGQPSLPAAIDRTAKVNDPGDRIRHAALPTP